MSEIYSEFEFEPEYTADYGDAGEYDYADYVEPGHPVEADPAGAFEAAKARVDEVASEAERYIGPTRQTWEVMQARVAELQAQVAAHPDYQAVVSEQQALARAELAVESFLEQQVPESSRERTLELASEYAEKASARYGADAEVAEAALIGAAAQARYEAQAADAFAEATYQAAKAVGADVASLDIAEVFRRAQAAMPAVAKALPGAAADEIAVRAIIGAVRAVGSRAVPRPFSEDYDIAARLVRKLRGPQPRQQTTQNYLNGSSVVSRFNGTRKRDE